MNQDNKDFRTQYILHPGDMIQTGKTTYTITDGFTAYGGSAVVYSARCSEDQIDYVIKEVFPNKEGLFQREKGIVCATDPNDERSRYMLENYRSKLVQEQALGSRCFNNTILAVPVRKIIHPDAVTIDGSRFTDVSYSPFAVLDSVRKKSMSFSKVLEEIRKEESEDHPLRTGDCPALHTTACLMEQVLLTLQTIHRQNVLFGDLHLDNVLFSECRLEEKRVGVACFLDFGCARELIDGEKTAVIEDKDVLSTKGYIPPEILHRNDGTLQLTRAADIFSVGCLLLRCLVPEDEWDYLGVSPDTDSIAILTSDAKRLGIDEKLRRDVNRILKRAMQPNPKDRYPSVDEMLKDIQKLIEQLRPPKNQLSLSLSTLAPGEFRGREEEIREIDRYICEHRKPIELYGFGGMGKSELAIEYCRRKMESSDICVHFVRFDKSIRNTIVGSIANAFSGYSRFTEQGIPKSEQVVYTEVMKMLAEQNENDILCIDNVDSETEEFSDLCGSEYRELCQLHMNLIITTRFDRGEFGGIEVGALKRNHLHDLITYILDDSSLTLSENQMDDLIIAVDSHTLAVELIARTLKMNRPRLSPEELLKKLKSGDLGGRSLARVQSHKDRDMQKRRIEDHIRTLFSIASLPPREFAYLRNAILINPDYGLPYDWFAEAQPEFDQDVIQHLIERGWVQQKRQSDLIAIHPLIHAVANKEITPSVNCSSAFLCGLWKIFERNQFDGDRSDPIAYILAFLPSPLDSWIPESWLKTLCEWFERAVTQEEDRLLETENKIIEHVHRTRIAYQEGGIDYHTIFFLNKKTIEYIATHHPNQESVPQKWREVYVVAGILHLEKETYYPDKALSFFLRAKELGATDVDDLIELAKAAII